MSDWTATAAERLSPVFKRVIGEILRSKVVRNGDTPVPVQEPDSGELPVK
jgi:hypothetical protein